MKYLVALIMSVTIGLIFSAMIFVCFNNINKHVVEPKQIDTNIIKEKKVEVKK